MPGLIPCVSAETRAHVGHAGAWRPLARQLRQYAIRFAAGATGYGRAPPAHCYVVLRGRSASKSWTPRARRRRARPRGRPSGTPRIHRRPTSRRRARGGEDPLAARQRPRRAFREARNSPSSSFVPSHIRKSLPPRLAAPPSKSVRTEAGPHPPSLRDSSAPIEGEFDATFSWYPSSAPCRGRVRLPGAHGAVRPIRAIPIYIRYSLTHLLLDRLPRVWVCRHGEDFDE